MADKQGDTHTMTYWDKKGGPITSQVSATTLQRDPKVRLCMDMNTCNRAKKNRS